MTIKICVEPKFVEAGRPGGVQRVVDAQVRYLPLYGLEIVDEVADADLYIGHAGNWTPRNDIPRVARCLR